jgi:hypothetical protein
MPLRLASRWQFVAIPPLHYFAPRQASRCQKQRQRRGTVNLIMVDASEDGRLFAARNDLYGALSRDTDNYLAGEGNGRDRNRFNEVLDSY